MRKSFKTTKRTLVTAVMAALLSCGVMGTGFAAAVEGISYDGGTLTPGSDGTIAVSAIMTAGGISSYLLKTDFTEFKEVTGPELVDLRKDMILLGADMLHESDFNEYKTNTAATLGTMQTAVSSLSDLTAGFPEGKTIKGYVDDSITVVNGEISGLDGRVSAAEGAIDNINSVTIPKITTDISDLQSGKLDKSDFNEYKSNTAATLGTMATTVNSLNDLTAGFPEGKTIKKYVDEGLDDSVLKTTFEAFVQIAATKEELKVKADTDLGNITDEGKGVVRNIAQEAINVVGDGPISVAKSDVGGVDTYTVSVKTDGKVESGDTGIVTGGTVFKETRVSGNGNHIKAANSAAKNLEALDTAIGSTADGNYVKASNSVGENLGALDAQLAALAGGAGAGLDELSQRIDNMDSKVEKVGAGAAALAALHPMDTDSKFSAAAGFGNYRGANAMALGMFYRPTDQVMFSMGGSMGNGENLLNVGVSFALDKGVSTGKAAMAKRITNLSEENKSIKAENAQMKAEIQALKEALVRLEAKIDK